MRYLATGYPALACDLQSRTKQIFISIEKAISVGPTLLSGCMHNSTTYYTDWRMGEINVSLLKMKYGHC